jgi:hypothetical protein
MDKNRKEFNEIDCRLEPCSLKCRYWGGAECLKFQLQSFKYAFSKEYKA